MASSALHLLAISIALLSIISVAYAARPCKTLTLISSYSFSITPQNPNPNPNPVFSSNRYVTVLTVRRLNPYFIRPRFINRHGRLAAVDHSNPIQPPRFSLPFVSENLNSFKDRTRDILSVVVALLFGAGCGALTAATMYLVWAVFANRRSCEFDEDYESDGYDDASPKKMGYVRIPEPVKEVKEAA